VPTPNRSGVNLFFVVVGVLLWFLAYEARQYLPPNNVEASGVFLIREILKDVGVVVFSLAAVDFLWQRFGGDPVQGSLSEILNQVKNQTREAITVLALTREAYTNGVIRISRGAGEITENEVLELICNASRLIDMCGYTLYYVFEREALARALEDRARSGVTVRICVCDPGNADAFTNVRPETVDGMKGLMAFAMNTLQGIKARLNPTMWEVSRQEN
jgi:hypothetical protein